MAEVIYTRTEYYPRIFILRIVRAVIGIIEIMLGLRLVLELLGASPSSQFIAWVYGVTGNLVAPFAGAFPSLTVGAYAAEFSTIFAMIGYAIIGWLIARVLSFIFSI
jgi:hypothetical protein